MVLLFLFRTMAKEAYLDPFNYLRYKRNIKQASKLARAAAKVDRKYKSLNVANVFSLLSDTTIFSS